MQRSAGFEMNDEVAITVIEGGRMSKKVLHVANVYYAKDFNKFSYQLKETKESQTTYASGKWYRETELNDP